MMYTTGWPADIDLQKDPEILIFILIYGYSLLGYSYPVLTHNNTKSFLQ